MFLVLGANGGFGRAVVRELQRRDLPVRALVRGAGPDLPGVEVVRGDASDREDLCRAMEGCEVVFNGVAVPLRNWETELRRVQDAVLYAVEATGPLLVSPSTTHGLKPIFGVPLPPRAPLTEPIDRPSRLSQIRSELEMQIEQDSDLRGVRSVLLRSCDWFGPGVRSGVCAEMGDAVRAGKAIPWYGTGGHAFSNVKDAAAIAVGVALLPPDSAGLRRRVIAQVDPDEPLDKAAHAAPTYSRFQIVNVTSHIFESAGEWMEAIQKATGRPTRAAAGALAMLRLRTVWSAEARAFTQALRPWEAVVCLDDAQTRSLLPDYEPEPLDDGLRAWLMP